MQKATAEREEALARAQSEQQVLLGTAGTLQAKQVEALAAERAAKEELAQVSSHGAYNRDSVGSATKLYGSAALVGESSVVKGVIEMVLTLLCSAHTALERVR